MSCSPSTSTTTTSSADSSRTIGFASIAARRVPKAGLGRNVSGPMADRLDRYRSKRDFATTPEPGGDAPAAEEALNRFVVHEHHARRLHWDLRLERDGVLVSWALPKGVPQDPKENRLAVRTEDHPLEYLDFEGEIPKGEYGAGTIAIWDRGTYETEKFRDDEVIVRFAGKRVRGKYAIF